MIYKKTGNFRILILCFVYMFLSIINICEAKGVCKNLSKVNDIDELLFQFYTHIDNQCLFEMPVEELEKAWGIPVFEYDSEKWKVIGKDVSQLTTEGDGFYVIKQLLKNNVSVFYIKLTNRYKKKNQGYGGSLSKGQYPKLLPAPQIIVNEGRINPPDSGESMFPIPENTIYQQQTGYYWINQMQSDEQPILFFLTDYFRYPVIMGFYSQAKTIEDRILL